jgi:hypothetical protein
MCVTNVPLQRDHSAPVRALRSVLPILLCASTILLSTAAANAQATYSQGLPKD